MNSLRRTFGEALNTWVQTIAIVMAGVWAVYVFVYREITLPQSAPVNVTLALQLAMPDARDTGTGSSAAPNEKATAGGGERVLLPVHFDFSITNPSTRPVDLLPSAWLAYAFEVDESATSRRDFDQSISEAIAAGTITSKHALIRGRQVVAGGALVSDTGIKPNETVRGTYLIYVPADHYDYIEVVVSVPTAVRSKDLTLVWQVDDFKLRPQLYRLLPGGDRVPVPDGAEGADERMRRELQMAVGREMLALW